MKSFNYYFILLAFGLLSSCSSDDAMQEEVSILGDWELTEWRIGLSADINNDGISSFNLLDEIECQNSEIITLDDENIISVVIEHSPKIFLTGTADSENYQYHLSCSEGVIGNAGNYTLINDNTIEAFGSTYIKDGNLLTKTTEFDVEIYNEDLTEALGILTSVRVYSKR